MATRLTPWYILFAKHSKRYGGCEQDENQNVRFFIGHYGYIGSKDGWAEPANMQEKRLPVGYGFRLSAQSSRTLLGSLKVSGASIFRIHRCLRETS